MKQSCHLQTSPPLFRIAHYFDLKISKDWIKFVPCWWNESFNSKKLSLAWKNNSTPPMSNSKHLMTLPKHIGIQYSKALELRTCIKIRSTTSLRNYKLLSQFNQTPPPILPAIMLLPPPNYHRNIQTPRSLWAIRINLRGG